MEQFLLPVYYDEKLSLTIFIIAINLFLSYVWNCILRSKYSPSVMFQVCSLTTSGAMRLEKWSEIDQRPVLRAVIYLLLVFAPIQQHQQHHITTALPPNNFCEGTKDPWPWLGYWNIGSFDKLQEGRQGRLWAAQDQSSKMIRDGHYTEHKAREHGAGSWHPIGSKYWWTNLAIMCMCTIKFILHSLIFCLADTCYWHVGTEACIRKSCA